MSVAVTQVLDGMPDPSHLHKIDIDGQTVIMLGEQVLFSFAVSDIGMRNIAVVTLTQLKFASTDVAALTGLTAQYVSMLRGRARDHGSAGLVRDRGRPTKLTARQITRARSWRAENLSDVVIGQRLGVADTTVARALRDHPAPSEPPSIQDDLEPEPQPEPQPAPAPEAVPACRGSAW